MNNFTWSTVRRAQADEQAKQDEHEREKARLRDLQRVLDNNQFRHILVDIEPTLADVIPAIITAPLDIDKWRITWQVSGYTTDDRAASFNVWISLIPGTGPLKEYPDEWELVEQYAGNYPTAIYDTYGNPSPDTDTHRRRWAKQLDEATDEFYATLKALDTPPDPEPVTQPPPPKGIYTQHEIALIHALRNFVQWEHDENFGTREIPF